MNPTQHIKAFILLHLFFSNISLVFPYDSFLETAAVQNQDLYDEVAVSIVTNNIMYQRAVSEYEVSSIKQMQRDLKYFPKLLVTPNYSISKNTISDEQSSIDVKLSLLQDLPLGGTIQLQSTQNLYLPNSDSSEYIYSPNFNANINIPFLLNPDLAKYTLSMTTKLKKYEKEIAYWKLLWAFISAQHDGIEKVGNFLVTQLNVKNKENREQLLKQQAADDAKTFELGKLSFIDISKRDRERFQNTIDLETHRVLLDEYSDYIDALHLKNTIAGVKMNEFIEYWEGISKQKMYEGSISEKIDAMNNMNQWNQDCLYELASAPNVAIFTTITPQSDRYGNVSPWDAVQNYWKGNIRFSWSFTASLSILLDPSMPILKSKELFNNKRKVYEFKQSELQKTGYESTLHRESMLANLKEKISSAEKVYELEQSLTKLAQEYMLSGRLSVLDFKLQECLLEDARIAVLQSRLNYLLSVISPW